MAQMAIALVLLTGAALTAKSFWNLLQVSPGFRTEYVLTARVSLPASRYPDVQRIAAFQSGVAGTASEYARHSVRRANRVSAS